MSDRIEKLREAYAAATDAAYAADDAKRQWREAKAALEAAEKEVRGD